MQLQRILYGGDYNPEQWLHDPEILARDVEMFKEASINTVSIGMFSWSMLEPNEGEYNLDYLEEIINRLHQNGISTILSTPSAARPKWMSDCYSEVLRVNPFGHRYLFGGRHNHCYTSPVYRSKIRKINTLLAERFGKHPAVILWHISNEYGGECYCPLCQDAFRIWLEKKYTTIDSLNQAWMTTFWSHTYNEFSQIEAPSPLGESMVHGLNLDWKRFISDQTVDFAAWEIQALRDAGSMLPTTTNMMYHFPGIDYDDMANVIDVISWDTYPLWHKMDDIEISMDCGFQHDYFRSLKHQPFLLMESCPGPTNWQGISKLKRPGMIEAMGLHAIAHGSDSILYFQMRQSRGSSEKFHGAVIEHYGKKDARMYREVADLGKDLVELSELIGTTTDASVAIIYDLQNRWALEDSQGPRNDGLFYRENVLKPYRAFKKLGVNVDIISSAQSLDSYQIIIAPMLYMFRADIESRIRSFIHNGGTFVLGTFSGIVNETDLCHLGGTPHELMDVFGLRRTETDGLYEGEKNWITSCEELFVNEPYEVRHLCDLLSTSTAQTLYIYKSEFYSNTAAVTLNQYGDGKAYYIGCDVEQRFYDDFVSHLIARTVVNSAIQGIIPYGIEVNSRSSDSYTYTFIQNFNNHDTSLKQINLKGELMYGTNLDTLAAYQTIIMKTKKNL